MDYWSLVETALTPFLDHPENLEITVSPSEDRTTVIIRVHKTDHAYVHGKNGSMITSLRTILGEAGKLHGDRVKIELLEPKVGEKEFHKPFEAKLWTRDDSAKLHKIASSIFHHIFGDRVRVWTAEHETHSEIVIQRVDVSLEMEASLTVLFRSISKGLGRGAIRLVFEQS